MNDEQLYALLVWGLKAAGGLALLVTVLVAIWRATPVFPEDDGERM